MRKHLRGIPCIKRLIILFIITKKHPCFRRVFRFYIYDFFFIIFPLDFGAGFERAGKRDFVGVLDFAAHADALRDTRDLDAHGL